MGCALFVLNTGSGPEIIRESELPFSMERETEPGTLTEICDAKNPILMSGTIKLPVKLGRTMEVDDFITCNKFFAPIILGANFCDRFFEAIFPCRSIEYFHGHITVPVTRMPLKRPGITIKVLEEQHKGTQQVSSFKVRRARKVTIPQESQQFVEVSSEEFGQLLVQTLPKFYYKYELGVAKGVVQVDKEK